jgi:hypothetical protein
VSFCGARRCGLARSVARIQTLGVVKGSATVRPIRIRSQRSATKARSASSPCCTHQAHLTRVGYDGLSMTPLRLDLTDYAELKRVQKPAG